MVQLSATMEQTRETQLAQLYNVVWLSKGYRPLRRLKYEYEYIYLR